MNKTLGIVTVALFAVSMITISYATSLEVVVRNDINGPGSTSIDNSVDVVHDFQNNQVASYIVKGDNTLIENGQLESFISQGDSPVEPNLAPHMKGYGQNKAFDSAFEFKGVDSISYLGNGGGNIKVRGWAAQDTFDVFCHGEYLTTVDLGRGHNGSFEVYVDLPLSHQVHSEEIVDEWMEGHWYFKTTRTYMEGGI